MNNEVEILLVEDNPNDAELAMKALRHNNLANNVIRVCDGEEALDFIFARGTYKYRERLNIPKLILLDIKLPKVDGLELLKIIKADQITKLIPVVVLTSSNEESDMIETYRLGINSYIGFYWLLVSKQPDIKKLVK
jgi:two-component system response regulator